MRKRVGKIIKWTLLGLLAVVTVLVVAFWDLVRYGAEQGYGRGTSCGTPGP